MQSTVVYIFKSHPPFSSSIHAVVILMYVSSVSPRIISTVLHVCGRKLDCFVILEVSADRVCYLLTVVDLADQNY